MQHIKKQMVILAEPNDKTKVFLRTETINNEISMLIEQCKLGNQQAQMTLYNKYYRMAYNTAFRLVKNKQDAEDLMQEAFLTCFDQLESLHETAKFGGWLKKTVINKSINYLNRNKNKWLTLHDKDAVETESEPQDDKELESIQVKLIYEEIKNLPEGYRIILTLYLIEGYDHQEIAEILNIKSSTSRSQYTRARQKLKDNLLRKYERQFEK